jgi:hypothetical protein
MIAQPAIAHHEPFALRDGAAVCAVERAILRGLGSYGSTGGRLELHQTTREQQDRCPTPGEDRTG